MRGLRREGLCILGVPGRASLCLSLSGLSKAPQPFPAAPHCCSLWPVRYYDQDTSRPVSFYLSSLEDLLAWTPSGEDSFNVALEPRASRQPPLSSPRPRTLLCHDMMGGYLDDR